MSFINLLIGLCILAATDRCILQADSTRLARPLVRSTYKSSINAVCDMPKIKNGSFRLRNRGKGIRYNCLPGFKLQGSRYSLCQMGRWEDEVPVCTKPGCKLPSNPENGYILDYEFNGSTAMLLCNDGYTRAGSTLAYCDGKQWDHQLGQCRENTERTEPWCDFETRNMCGWAEDLENDFPWVRKSGWMSFEKVQSGPKHDHTIGRPMEGHYMVAEATNKRSNQRARLYSQIYNQTFSKNACFRFFYHMYGVAVGRLRVYMKPLSIHMDNVADDPKLLLFEMYGSQGNQWNEAFFEIEQVDDSFQIVFEATGSRAIISDIAIDDVALMNNGDCVKFATTEAVTEEIGGIYDVQSCVNRCNETQSVRMESSSEPNVDGHGGFFEKCDCHSDCIDLETCCFDYRLMCMFGNETTDTFGETLSTESTDKIMTETEEIEIEDPIYNKTESIKVYTTTPSTTISTQTSSTASTSTTPVTIRSTIVKTTEKIIPRTTATTKLLANTTITTSTTASIKFMPKLPKIVKNDNTTVVTKRFKPSTAKAKPIPVTELATSTTKKVTSILIVTQKPAINSAKTAKNLTATNRLLEYTSHTSSSRIAFSIILILTALLIVSLTVWKYFVANKWNRYSSHSIEYKSKYYSKRVEEPLVRSNSFIIEETTTATDISDIDVKSVASEKEMPSSTEIFDNADNQKSESSKKSTEPTTSVKKTAGKTKKSSKSRRNVDEYSDIRLLTADYEHFDFTLQNSNNDNENDGVSGIDNYRD